MESHLIVIWIVTLFDSIGFICIVSSLLFVWDDKYMPTFHRYGMAAMAGGLLAQIYRNILTFQGQSPKDEENILWVLKDFGIGIVAFGVVIWAVKNRLKK